MLRKANVHSVAVCRLIKKSIMQIKIGPRGKINSNFFAYEVLIRRNLIQYIYLLTPQETEIVVNSRQSSSLVNSLGSLLMAPHKSSSCLRLFPFPPYDKCKKHLATSLLLQVPQIMTRQHKQFPLTFFCSFDPRPLAFHKIPTHRGILVEKGCFSNLSPCF